MSNKMEIQPEPKNEHKEVQIAHQDRFEIADNVVAQQQLQEYEQDSIPLAQDINNFDSQLQQAYMDHIQSDIEKEDVAIISDVIDLVTLEKEYENNEGFLQKIKYIKNSYPHYRRVRRDGSCFYRALLYKILEKVVLYGDQQLQNKLCSIIEKSKQDLINIGYESIAIEDFHSFFKNKLDQTRSEYFTPDQLMSFFTDKETADTMNMYLRMLTSGYIKANVSFLENFEDFEIYGGVDQFCSFMVDPIDKDADQLQIIALCSYLQVSIKIIYLDSNINVVEPTIFLHPENSENHDVTLLYRPGHYDILYGF